MVEWMEKVGRERLDGSKAKFLNVIFPLNQGLAAL